MIPLRGALRAAAAAAAVLSSAALQARAQTASLVADVEISTTILSIVNPQDLRFGAQVPGTPMTVDARTSANAGALVIHGNRNAEISITWTLPAALVVGPYAMPVSFGPTSGCWRNRTGQAGCTRYDPRTTLIRRIRNARSPNNTFFVWLGGTVSPTPTQHPGMYRAPVTLSVVYTGN
jgi:hypothetical protein